MNERDRMRAPQDVVIQMLIRAGEPVDRDRLADPSVALAEVAPAAARGA